MTEYHLSMPVNVIKNIGPKKSKYLEKLNIYTIGDLLFHFPRDYEDRSKCEKIAYAKSDQPTLICGRIEVFIKGKYIRGKKTTCRLLVSDDSGKLEIVFFNIFYGERIFKPGDMYFFYGRITDIKGKRQMVHPDFSKADEETDSETGLGILPVYGLTAGISANDMRKWCRYALAELKDMQEFLPPVTITRNRLCDCVYAIENIHFPKDSQSLKIAQFRLIFEEFFLLQTGLLSIRNRQQAGKKGIKFQKDDTIHAFLNTVAFKLTGAQLRTIDEIESDMCSDKIMNRLVQGDVGSGKTIVAAAAIYKCAASGFQAVMMAPTEILARQHYDGLCRDFNNEMLRVHNADKAEDAYVRVGFLSGSMPAKERTQILKELEEGTIDVLIGTHAVIQPGVGFKKLGLVITDEQHRFGVKQRSMLTAKGNDPDMIVMTATPIPRTLALILYGDLDISLIDEMPPGRKEIITYSTDTKKRKRAYDFVEKEIKAGRQAYVVSPLIGDSDAQAMAEVRSAESVYEELRGRFPQHHIALLHGEMKQKDKDGVLKAFSAGEIQILVATVVIEVGINIPNASVMVIENAERFGLAQMHQLRGRVGRGEYQSYCILISEFSSELVKERAEIMKKSASGFVIAEKDLELRGPGEFFGTRQHGVPELKVANLAKHMKILKMAQQETELILRDDPLLQRSEHQTLLSRTREMFKNVEEFNI